MQASALDHEKYRNEARFRLKQLSRLPILRTIERLTQWQPLDHPEEGYSIIIGCNTRLARMLGCNLKYLARQNLTHLDRILIILDRPRDEMADDIEPVIRSRFPRLPLEVVYTKMQRRICSTIRWPWVRSWLSWSIGIGRLNTRYGFLHDFDAMLLRPDIIEERFRAIRERGHQYIGVRFYDGNGVVPEDELATTFELMFDAQFVRQAFAPLNYLFNQVARFKGRRVEFDTFLYAQSRHGKASPLLPSAKRAWFIRRSLSASSKILSARAAQSLAPTIFYWCLTFFSPPTNRTSWCVSPRTLKPPTARRFHFSARNSICRISIAITSAGL